MTPAAYTALRRPRMWWKRSEPPPVSRQRLGKALARDGQRDQDQSSSQLPYAFIYSLAFTGGGLPQPACASPAGEKKAETLRVLS
jgi:hypothetical protein